MMPNFFQSKFNNKYVAKKLHKFDALVTVRPVL